MTSRTDIPGLVPTLAAGRHRTARQGACFMEFASYLAGERWSDRPPCTDPTLALLARAVNDTLPDRRRGELVLDVPRVVGLRGDDRVIALLVAARAAAEALPVASMERQHALASGLLSVEAALADLDPEALPEGLLETALAAAPNSVAWAREQQARMRVRHRDLVRHGAPSMVATAVAGIAFACVPDPEDRLIRLLRAAIGDVERALGGPVAAADDARRTSREQLPVGA